MEVCVPASVVVHTNTPSKDTLARPCKSVSLSVLTLLGMVTKECSVKKEKLPKIQSKTMWCYLKIVFSQLGGLEQTYVRGLAESFLKLNLNIFRSKILVQKSWFERASCDGRQRLLTAGHPP